MSKFENVSIFCSKFWLLFPLLLQCRTQLQQVHHLGWKRQDMRKIREKSIYVSEIVQRDPRTVSAQSACCKDVLGLSPVRASVHSALATICNWRNRARHPSVSVGDTPRPSHTKSVRLRNSFALGGSFSHCAAVTVEDTGNWKR
jgi:hypothetical protein